MAVVVRDWPRRIERVDEGKVQLPSVCLTGSGTPLVYAVEEVPDDLVGDQQSQQARTARARQDREESSAVDVPALGTQRIERILTDRCIGDSVCELAPAIHLAGDGGQSP